jgi:hypothetical protein
MKVEAMPRIKIDELPVLENLSQDQAKGIFGGGTADMHIEPVVQFDNPILAKDDSDKTSSMDSETDVVERS